MCPGSWRLRPSVLPPPPRAQPCVASACRLGFWAGAPRQGGLQWGNGDTTPWEARSTELQGWAPCAGRTDRSQRVSAAVRSGEESTRDREAGEEQHQLPPLRCLRRGVRCLPLLRCEESSGDGAGPEVPWARLCCEAEEAAEGKSH